MLIHTIKLGTKNLSLHKLRSVLTVLGVILGVGSVIAMLAIGEGSKRAALEQIRRLGAANVILRSVKPGQNGDASEESGAGTHQPTSRVVEYGLKYIDLERLLATLPTVTHALPVALVRKDAQHEHRHIANARILGVTPEFLETKQLAVRYGRFLTVPDVDTTANVAVLGAAVAERLYSFEYPVNKPVLLGSSAYRVVGVLSAQGTAGTGSQASHNEYDSAIYIPLSAARQRFGELQVIRTAGSRDFERTQLHEITLTVRDTGLVSQTASMARKVLEDTHPRGDDYEAQVPLELLRQAEREKRIWNLVLGSIAGISLLVGGVGIMNIMLASVTERTREIGIRRALGAKRGDIIVQFLIESAVLSSTGGLLGVLFGVTIPFIVTRLAHIETVISWWSILLALGISAAIGILFGIYPARRAAHMDPIQALRHV